PGWFPCLSGRRCKCSFNQKPRAPGDEEAQVENLVTANETPIYSQLGWTQALIPELGLWQVMAEWMQLAGACALGRDSMEKEQGSSASLSAPCWPGSSAGSRPLC
ncbi:FXYD6, partial [Cervus elaphus hippelaphus]